MWENAPCRWGIITHTRCGLLIVISPETGVGRLRLYTTDPIDSYMEACIIVSSRIKDLLRGTCRTEFAGDRFQVL